MKNLQNKKKFSFQQLLQFERRRFIIRSKLPKHAEVQELKYT